MVNGELGERPNEVDADEDEQEGGIREFGPGLEDEKERGEGGVAIELAGGRATLDAATDAQDVEHAKGKPVAAGDVELAKAGVEEFRGGESVDQAGEEAG